MSGKTNRSDKTPVGPVSQAPTNGAGIINPPLTPIKLQDIQPVAEAQRVAAQSSVSGRKAVSRATVFMALYLWLLSGVVILSWMAQRIQLFPGDMAITARLQKNHQPVLRKFFFGISEIVFPSIAAPITAITAVVFWILRFRLESIFILLTSSSTLLNQIVKRVIKRPRPDKTLVTVVRVINEPSFPSGHVMYYTNFYGLLIYLLTTNWRSGRIRNILIGVCASLIAFIGPSRVYLGAHWPSDVLAGYMYGGLWFAGLMALYLRIKSWIHPPIGKTPEVAKPLKQPSDTDDDDED